MLLGAAVSADADEAIFSYNIYRSVERASIGGDTLRVKRD